jgi:hypothetical protein
LAQDKHVRGIAGGHVQIVQHHDNRLPVPKLLGPTSAVLWHGGMAYDNS